MADHQLVIQFPEGAFKDFDALVSFEDSLCDLLGDRHEVDGHDIGSGEVNFFIFSDDQVPRLPGSRRAMANGSVTRPFGPPRGASTATSTKSSGPATTPRRSPSRRYRPTRTSAHQREVFSVKGWAGARVLVVGPCIAVIEVCSAACDRVVSTTGRGGL